MRGRAFLDSGIFIAFLVPGDHAHRRARELFASSGVEKFSSVLVLSETYSWFLHKLSEDAARTFRLFYRSMANNLNILPADVQHIAAVEKKLDLLRGTKLTFVDASNLVWMEELKISVAWSTDHDLTLEGARVIPGSTGNEKA